MLRTLLRLAIACVLVVVGWGSSASAWDTTAGNDTNYGSITFGGTGTDYGHGIALDTAGNIHVTGTFGGTVDFGAGDVTSAGSYDGFVVKLNSAGQAVVAGGGGGGGGGTPAAPPPPCPWPTATYVTEPGCVEPLKGGISVDADGTLFTVGNLDVTGVTIDLEDGETATDIELVSGATTTGYVLTSKQRIIGFGDTPVTDPDGTDLVTLWPGETVTQLSNNRNGTHFATSHGRVFDINGNPYVDLSGYVTTNNIVDIKTTDSGSGILIGADGGLFDMLGAQHNAVLRAHTNPNTTAIDTTG